MAAVSLAARSQPRKLRVGVFADSRLQPRWIAEAFARVAASECAEVALVECTGAPQAGQPLAWRLYERFDRWAFGADPSARVDLASFIPEKTWSVPDFGLDVAFALGAFDDTRLDGIARHGVWRFHFDGETEAQAGARAVARGEPVSGSGLKVRLAAGAAPRLAYRSWARTYPFSVARNRDQLLRKTGEFVLRALRELQVSGQGWLEQCEVLHENSLADDPGLIDLGSRLVKRGIERALHVEQWSLAFRLREQRFGEPPIAPDLAGFTRLVPPPDRDWADPFALEKGGRHWIFFEEKPYATGKAHIAATEVGPGGRFSPPVRVLERDYHLSYPFLLQHQGALYMVPESAQAGTVELWRCVDFPHRWTLEKVLLDGVRCVDATLHCADGRWWMFANVAPGGSRSFDDELHLFFADSLTGEWKPHPRNPVRSDARSARPAGAFFRRRGALCRPAQVCVPRYGAGLSIQRVLRLSTGEYAERQVERIMPSPASGILGIHTLNRAGYLTVVDAFARRRRSLRS